MVDIKVTGSLARKPKRNNGLKGCLFYGCCRTSFHVEMVVNVCALKVEGRCVDMMNVPTEKFEIPGTNERE
jgi:hypothetical protein